MVRAPQCVCARRASLTCRPLLRRNSINENDEAHGELAQGYVDTLLRLMQGKIEELQNGHEDMFLLRMRLEEILQDFHVRSSARRFRRPFLIALVRNAMRGTHCAWCASSRAA